MLPIALRRGTTRARGLRILDDLEQALEVVDRSLNEPCETEVCARIERRDPNDWPILATSLLLGCPLWTEDNIEFYLRPR